MVTQYSHLDERSRGSPHYVLTPEKKAENRGGDDTFGPHLQERQGEQMVGPHRFPPESGDAQGITTEARLPVSGSLEAQFNHTKTEMCEYCVSEEGVRNESERRASFRTRPYGNSLLSMVSCRQSRQEAGCPTKGSIKKNITETDETKTQGCVCGRSVTIFFLYCEEEKRCFWRKRKKSAERKCPLF